ncbi:MAG: hypothetical protein V3V21_06065 [Thermoplasmata archaeon]
MYTMRCLLFLLKVKRATLSDTVSKGWNRRTTATSILKAVSLELVERIEQGSFPRFLKTYRLTDKGEYVARFVRLLEEVVGTDLCDKDGDFRRFPKGCWAILAFMCRSRVNSISDILYGLGISPSQLYKCLSHMESKGIIFRNRCRKGGVIVPRLFLTEAGVPVSAAAEALDQALRRVGSLSECQWSAKLDSHTDGL